MPLALATARPAPAPDAGSGRSTLSADAIVPVLCPREALSSRGANSPTGIQLSRTLSVMFVAQAPAQARGTKPQRVSQHDLGRLGLSPRQAWDRAAANLQRSALTDQGLRFSTRSAALTLPGADCGLEVRAQGCPATSWLAHPVTLAIVDEHLRRLTRAPRLTYLAPDNATLYALVDPSPAQAVELALRAADFRPAHRPAVSAFPLVLANGFPRELM